MTIAAIIVDDENHARQALRHFLSDYPSIDIKAECANGLAAVKAVHDLRPEVMFLDIHMPKLSGFEVLELLGDTAPLVVFITAHDEYAIAAFENNAIDYLLKPIAKERLAKTIERLQARLSLAGGPSQPWQGEQQKMVTLANDRQMPLSRLLVRDKGDVHVIACADIYAVEAADDYVVIHTASGSHIKQDRLSRIEEQLDSQIFCRIHRSTLINIDYLQSIESEGKEARFAKLKDNKCYPISRAGYAKLIERM